IDGDERLAGQTLDRVGHLGLLYAVTAGDLLGSVEREPTRENGEPPKNHLLVGRKQLMAPVEGGPNGLLAVGAARPPLGEQIALLREADRHLLRAQCAKPCR